MRKAEIKDREKKHYQVTKAGDVMRIISKNMAIKLYSMKGEDVPVLYHVWGEHGIAPVASKSEIFNPGVIGIFVGRIEDMAADYNAMFSESQDCVV